MNDSVSFLEIQLVDGQLFAVLGSGPRDDVLRRAVSTPYVRLCMRDAAVEKFRIQCGTVDVRPTGMTYGKWDEFQFRGASIKAFVWSGQFARRAPKHRATIHSILAQSDGCWLEYSPRQIARVERSVALSALSQLHEEADSNLLVDFHVPLDRVDEVLDQLSGSFGDSG